MIPRVAERVGEGRQVLGPGRLEVVVEARDGASVMWPAASRDPRLTTRMITSGARKKIASQTTPGATKTQPGDPLGQGPPAGGRGRGDDGRRGGLGRSRRRRHLGPERVPALRVLVQVRGRQVDQLDQLVEDGLAAGSGAGRP